MDCKQGNYLYLDIDGGREKSLPLFIDFQTHVPYNGFRHICRKVGLLMNKRGQETRKHTLSTNRVTFVSSHRSSSSSFFSISFSEQGKVRVAKLLWFCTVPVITDSRWFWDSLIFSVCNFCLNAAFHMAVIFSACMFSVSAEFSVRADNGTYFGGFLHYPAYHLIAHG